jgi:hypothetical protein
MTSPVGAALASMLCRGLPRSRKAQATDFHLPARLEGRHAASARWPGRPERRAERRTGCRPRPSTNGRWWRLGFRPSNELMRSVEALRNPNRDIVHLDRCPSLKLNRVDTTNWERISLSSPNALRACPYCISLYEERAAARSDAPRGLGPEAQAELIRLLREAWPDLVAATRKVATLGHAAWQRRKRRRRKGLSTSARNTRAATSAFDERAPQSRRARPRTEPRLRGNSH